MLMLYRIAIANDYSWVVRSLLVTTKQTAAEGRSVNRNGDSDGDGDYERGFACRPTSFPKAE